jgi:hypothetical protein
MAVTSITAIPVDDTIFDAGTRATAVFELVNETIGMGDFVVSVTVAVPGDVAPMFMPYAEILKSDNSVNIFANGVAALVMSATTTTAGAIVQSDVIFFMVLSLRLKKVL